MSGNDAATTEITIMRNDQKTMTEPRHAPVDVPNIAPPRFPNTTRRSQERANEVQNGLRQFENNYRQAEIRFTRSEWKRRGYRVKPNAGGRHYTYIDPHFKTRQGWRYTIDECERIPSRRPLHRLKYGRA